MRLKRLVARGFKSFADRTEFEFDTRLTGIIGPNGCGKSNVVDAIKWVLGDQRAKSLRGAEMTDVIFKGAEGREAMGMAEVTITFEDPEGRLEGRQEIDIARRLTLDKESSYLLNGHEVRLKDVRDVLLDTGLGTGGYAVMEQGRIDAVLSANPEARRAIFEEAAGVSRFKLQKKEALRKLERTDQNLARVTDLLEERARRIRSLRIQAGKARRFHELQAALRDLRTALAVVDGTVLRAELRGHERRLAEVQVELGAAEDGCSGAGERLAAADEAIAGCARALEHVQDELRSCQGELTTHRERADSQRQRASDLLAELERGRQRAQGLVEQRDERATALAMARDDLAQKEGELIDLHKALEQQRQAAHAALAVLRSLQQQREALRERQLELLHRRTRARNVASDVTARIAAARAREQRLDERQGVLGAECARLFDETAVLLAQRTDQGTRERILVEREQHALSDLEGADAAAAKLAEREANLRYELSQVEGRRQALLGMEAHMEGFDQGPRHVLEQQPPGLRGRLLDLIEIDLEHGAALEAALGPFVQALVVDTREHAAAIVRELAEKRLGRVLLLVEEAFGEQPPGGSGLLLPPPKGVSYLSALVRHVATSSASPKLLGWLLRGVVVADFDIADASRADLCFVTPEGTLVCGPRMEGGAAAEGHAGLVVRRSQILQLGEQAALLQARLTELQAGKDQAVGRVDRLKRELKALGDALQIVRRAVQAIEAQEARLGARHQDVERELGELAHEGADLSRTRCDALARLGTALFDQFLLTRREAAAQAEEQAFGQRIGEAETAAQAQQRAEQESRIRQVQAGEAREGLLRSIRMHEDALRDFERALHELVDRQQDAEGDRTRALAEHERLSELAAALEQRLAEIGADKQERQAGLDGSRQQRASVQQELQQWEQRRAAANESLTQTRLAMAEVSHRFVRLEDRLREDSGIELRRCLGEIEGIGLEHADDHQGPVAPPHLVEQLQGPPLPPAVLQSWYGLDRLWQKPAFDTGEARKEVQILQSQKDRLGAVNVDAVQELDAEEGQFSTLEQEVSDLKEARRSLMETLRRLETESKLLFEQTFHEARKNFQEIFRKLFQGGKADMFLSFESPGKTEDLLEAGIEIVAQPPGKQLQSINLLSGGERSLTAVAILFALFKVRPSPFCILDEVDAALDETNVERFLRVLRDFTANTQFCIVTHHKRTMADCQVLYGITMQRRGVSSRIAVALHEVDGFQEGAPVGAGTGKDPALQRRIAGEEQVGFA
ncbi:MAG TPA: chromosome segregation protein SMC [Planctomycetota bacterium]|nr:chromosome segregation protein SMC [Planctomycetota bacterium]